MIILISPHLWLCLVLSYLFVFSVVSCYFPYIFLITRVPVIIYWLSSPNPSFFVLLCDSEAVPYKICPFMWGSVSRGHWVECKAILRGTASLPQYSVLFLFSTAAGKLICKRPGSIHSPQWPAWYDCSLPMSSGKPLGHLAVARMDQFQVHVFWYVSSHWQLKERRKSEYFKLLIPFSFILPQLRDNHCFLP